MKFPLVAFALLSTAATSGAALLAYDGFNTYEAIPAGSGGGFQNPNVADSDALVWDNNTTTGDGYIGQAGAAAGFTGTWDLLSGGAIASNFYPQVQATTLGYTDPLGFELQTLGGSVRAERTSGSSGANKGFSHDLAIGMSLPETLYISGVFEVNATNPILIQSASGVGGTPRNFGMSTDASGNLSLFGEGAANTPAGTLSDGLHFFVWKLENNVDPNVASGDLFSGDRLTLFLDPTDLRAEAFNTATAAHSGAGTNFYVSANGAWSLTELLFGHLPNAVGDYMAFDELRVGTTWQSVAPIPEPSRALLAACGALGILLRRRR
ncbi:MAG: hypothetical protein R3F11_14255 [Verrucomicrobiales bacterium]